MSREMVNSGIPWIGEIPKEWEVIQGKRIYIANDGGVWGEEPNGVNDTIVLRSTEQDIDGHLQITEAATRLLSPKEIESAVLHEGDLIITKSSGSPSHIGKTSLITKEISELNCCFSNFIQRLRINGNPLYYWFLLNSHVVKEQFEYLSTTTTGINNINSQTLNNLIFPKLHILEQQKIASFLDKKCAEIDEMITLQEKIIEELKAYKQSVITEAVTKGLNPNLPMKESGIEWIGQIPAHWEVHRVKRIVQRFSKGEGITKDEVFIDGNISCVRYGEIYSKYNQSFIDCISLTNLNIHKSPRYFEYGDILCAGTGELVEEIGKTIVYIGQKRCLAGGDIIIIRHKQNPIFLNYALNSTYAQSQKSCNKSKLKVVHISASNIGNILLPIPSIDEQQSIADYLDTKCTEIDNLISIKQQKIENLKDYKKSIIYEYVTGKKEVED